MRRQPRAGRPGGRGDRAQPLDLPVAGIERRHGAKTGVVIDRVVDQREQILRAFAEHSPGRRFGGADEAPPTQAAVAGVETSHVGLRPDIAAAHRHVDVAAVGQRRALKRPAFLGRRLPEQPALGLQVQADQVAAVENIARLPAADW